MLIDFGWAHDGEQATSRAGGTAAFLAPEQTVRGEHPNAATDVYGLGAILYWLLTGSPVHQGESLDAILENISRGRELVWPTNATAPQPLRSLCGRCLLANRDERIQAVSDVRAELNSLE
jgi:serine/threonine-protein kinase